MSMYGKIAVAALLLILPGCAVKRYNERATAACLKKYTVEQCKPLTYPACESGNFGGQQCQ